MKKTTKLLTVIILLTMLFTTVSAAVNPNEKCKITVNGETVDWKLEPFLAYGPHGNVLILIPMEQLFSALGYIVIYDSKLNRSVFTAGKDSDYHSFYVDLKTGQAVEEGEAVKKGGLNQVNLINNNVYVYIVHLENIAKTFLNGSRVKVNYDYIHSKKENYIIQYSDYYSVHYNLSSLKIEVSAEYSDRPYIGEQYTKYNTGTWVSGAEVKKNFDESTLRNLWDGFDSLRFYTGKGEQNELTGKGAWNSTAYAVAWELMDGIAEAINRLRKQKGLSELTVDHSMCFVSVGAEDPKVDSVFDNSIHNFETNKAAHTYNGKTKMAECLATGVLRGAEGNSTSLLSAHIANRWYKSVKGHKKIIMGAKYKTMGILVVITDTGTGDAYAVFK